MFISELHAVVYTCSLVYMQHFNAVFHRSKTNMLIFIIHKLKSSMMWFTAINIVAAVSTQQIGTRSDS